MPRTSSNHCAHTSHQSHQIVHSTDLEADESEITVQFITIAYTKYSLLSVWSSIRILFYQNLMRNEPLPRTITPTLFIVQLFRLLTWPLSPAQTALHFCLSSFNDMTIPDRIVYFSLSYPSRSSLPSPFTLKASSKEQSPIFSKPSWSYRWIVAVFSGFTTMGTKTEGVSVPSR